MDLGMSFLAPIAADQKMELADAQEAREKALAPAKLAHAIATTRMLNAESGAMEQKQEVDRKVAAALAVQAAGPGAAVTGADGKPAPVSAQIMNMAKLLADAGDPIRALPLLAQASTAQSHEAQQTAAAQLATQRAAAAQMKVGELLSNLAGGITDQESWDAANKAVKLQTGQDSPLAGLPYNPRIVEALQNAGMKIKDQIAVDLNERKLESVQELRDDTVRHRRVLESVAGARLRTYQAKAAADKKVGGKDVGSPTGPEIKAATNLLGDLVDAKDMPTAAFDVAAQARSLRKANPGMSADDALRQAIDSKRQAGDFEVTVTPPKQLFNFDIPGTGSTSKKYEVKAIPLPASKKAADLKPNQAYRNSSGQVMIWSGKGWLKPSGPAGKAAPSRAAAASDGNDSEDDDDGDDGE
jgi:hypothetical protein